MNNLFAWIQPVIVHPRRDDENTTYHTQEYITPEVSPEEALIFFSIIAILVISFILWIRFTNDAPKNGEKYKIEEVDENYGVGFGISFYSENPQKRWIVLEWLDPYLGWSTIRESKYCYKLFRTKEAAQQWIDENTKT